MGFLQGNLGGSEAIALAVMVSVVNIGLSFLVARMCLTHYLNPVSYSFRRWVYLIFLLFFLMILIYVNSMIGVFRGLVEIANETGQRELLQLALTNSVMPFDDFSTAVTVQSVFLMLVGYFFALTAMLDGYYFDDPINGYGDLGRERSDLMIKLDNTRGSLLDALITLNQDKAFDDLQEKREIREVAVVNWGFQINALQGYERQFNSTFNVETNDSIDALINLYRVTNKNFRPSDLCPAYFDDPVNKSFIKTFTSVHPNIADEVMGDEERKREQTKFKKVIKEEYDASHAELTTYFSTEAQDLRDHV